MQDGSIARDNDRTIQCAAGSRSIDRIAISNIERGGRALAMLSQIPIFDSAWQVASI